MKKVRIGVIGLGHNGMAFCSIYSRNPKCELVAVCDLVQDRVDAAAEKYGVRGYNDYKILEDPDIDAISIHTPDCFHREPFIKALETNHHVFVEKPMADTLEDLELMVGAADRYKDKIAMVGHILRFDKYFAMVKNLINQGTLGKLFYVEADYIHDLRYQYFMEDWKVTKEVPMLGGGCHPLDLLRWYAGEVTEVSAMSNHIAYPEMYEDATMIATYKFDSGVVGKVTTLYGSIGARPYGFNLSVYGTKGSIVRDRICIDGMNEEWLKLPEAFDKGHDFTPEADHFLECILKSKKPLITPRDAANNVAAALYAVKASKENTILKIPRY